MGGKIPAEKGGNSGVRAPKKNITKDGISGRGKKNSVSKSKTQ